MSRRLRALALALLASAVMIALVVPASLAYLMESTATARNTFIMDPLLTEVQVPITVQKTVRTVRGDAISPEGFAFVLTDTQTNTTKTALSNAEGSASFLLSFCGLDEGVHSFTLHEQNDGRSGVTYDEQVYRIQVTISVDELPSAEIMLDGRRVESCAVSFENLYAGAVAGVPDTGDHTQPLLWLGLLLLSGSILLALRRRDGSRKA